jgi:uncharacterized membrane protein YcgQ (UPF0703/DUF1980 family)
MALQLSAWTRYLIAPSYGTLLGSTVFQSFIGGIVAFRVLPRPQFSTLQKNIFPKFFALQTITPAIMLFTYPSPSSLLTSPFSLASSTDRTSWWLITSMIVTGLANVAYFGPQTTEVMKLRKHQETRDGKKSYDEGPHSEEMKALNKKFGMLHGLSTLVNLTGLGAMVWYGLVLGERLSV